MSWTSLKDAQWQRSMTRRQVLAHEISLEKEELFIYNPSLLSLQINQGSKHNQQSFLK